MREKREVRRVSTSSPSINKLAHSACAGGDEVPLGQDMCGGGSGGWGMEGETHGLAQGLRQLENEWMPSPMVLSVILEASVYARRFRKIYNRPTYAGK